MIEAEAAGWSEGGLVERAAIELFGSLGYETCNCYFERFGDPSDLGRQTTNEVVLVRRLRVALQRLNPKAPDDMVELAVEEITRDRSALHRVVANREVHRFLKEGVRIPITGEDGEEHVEILQVIDWDHPDRNDFFLASQFWVTGDMYKRRPDLIVFVNGIPLVLLELKAPQRRIEGAFNDNLRDYKETIPQLFWYNAFIVLSNGEESKIGTMSASWEHFNHWKRISSEDEEGDTGLETMIRGTCAKERLLDIVENFILFSDIAGSPAKIVAKNHQYLGVNNAMEAVQAIRENQGRLGVFWHTQGAGKSYSMIFFSQKVLRKTPGNWTFLIVTDRRELDVQIYENFQSVGVVTEPHVQAETGKHLKQLLREDHRLVFTLIHKFHTETGETYPKLSDRSDVIVMADEAHRTQYDALASNMRTALPKAAFIAFTGTPLIVGEEKTRKVFGEYVSIYNFRQSVEDGATVRLYYEQRIPEEQLTNQEMNEKIAELLEAAELDEDEEKKLERLFKREYEIITRDDRLDKIAKDIVDHFMGRGYKGKAMVVSIDKATAIEMYDKVQKHWQIYLEDLKKQAARARSDAEAELLKQDVKFMEETDMAVVVSQGQNEIEEMAKKGLDIVPHRRRMVNEDLDTKFKDPEDPLRVAFVCAMWMTGFDAPPCSTIYLDKPMKNHTLMQTIARANRVFRDKTNGLIVDYYGIFRDVQKALAIYGSASGGGVKEGEMPVEDKEKLIDALSDAIWDSREFCTAHGVDLEKIQNTGGFEKISMLKGAVESIIADDESKRTYLSLASGVSRLYKAILPDPGAQEFTSATAVVKVIAEKIRSLAAPPEISGVMAEVEELLDESVAAEMGKMQPLIEDQEDRYIDLSQIDLEALEKKFAARPTKRIEVEKLRTSVQRKISTLLIQNHTRMNYQDEFQKMIDEYNKGALDTEEVFRRLVGLAKRLTEEEKRSISENLTEEELAVFDLLMKPEIELTKKERDQVKKTSRDLLATLKQERLVLDWRKRQQSRAQVIVTIQDTLAARLPQSFTDDMYRQKCDLVYQHVYDSYFGEGQSIYATPMIPEGDSMGIVRLK